MSSRMPFNSPIPQRFLKEWTSPLIPGLEEAASFDDAVAKASPVVMKPVNGSPLRERSFAETMTSDDAKLIQSWLNSEEEKNSADSKSHLNKAEREGFKFDSPSPKKHGSAVSNHHSFRSDGEKISIDSAFSGKLLSEQKRIFRRGSPSAIMMAKNEYGTMGIPQFAINPFGGPFCYYQVPSPDSQASFSNITSPYVPAASPLVRSANMVPSKSPISAIKTLSADSEASSSHATTPYALSTPSEPSPVFAVPPTGGSFHIFEAPPPKSDTTSFHSNASSSHATTPYPATTATLRPVLADISKTSEVEFVPNSWLTLYHSRPSEEDDESVQLAWLQMVSLHMRAPEVEAEPTPGAPLHVSLYSTASSRFSPISMPSALQTGRRPTQPGSNSVRSILKNVDTSMSANSSNARGRLSVRFGHPATTVKRPTKLQATPTTWPNEFPTPRVPRGDTAAQLFNDLWEENRPPVGKAGQKGWIPHQTPESTSTGSSHASQIVQDSQSSESKTTVLITGKENNLNVNSTATKSNENISIKSFPVRMPLKGKKLVYERSSSERNIMNGSLS